MIAIPKRFFATLLLLGALPPTAVAQTSDLLFLTCDTVRHYRGLYEGQTLPEIIFLKIDNEKSMISEFNVDRARYEDLCEQEGTTPELFDWRGTCLISEDLFYLNASVGGFASQWKNFRIYRGSGRISGSYRLYLGVALDYEDVKDNEPITTYEIEGRCRNGPDMSNTQRAF